MVHKMTTIISWESPEFVYHPKKPDWYWALALIILAGIIIALVDKNFLLGILVVLSGGLFFYFAQKKPHMMVVAISDQGISCNQEFFAYKDIDSFWIHEDDDEWKLLIHIHRIMSPLLSLPIPPDVSPLEMRELLLTFIPESEKTEPLAHRVSDTLGF
ncbi:MAG: hypothetical protein LRY44_00580 [Candidatus Pacebacteria bacterium]|nr:hypothetical protein [Candidatus Paceibacterota bacterium]MCD8563504.1 hypothetical protein [Candidatus Paceibacterota bacterium]